MSWIAVAWGVNTVVCIGLTFAVIGLYAQNAELGGIVRRFILERPPEGADIPGLDIGDE